MYTSVRPPRRVTLVRPGALGDTLLTLPALALLRSAAPAVHLHLTLIARAETLPLALSSGLADTAWPWELPDWGALFASDTPLSALAQATLAQSDTVVVWARDPDELIGRRLRALGVGQVIVAPPPSPTPLPRAAGEGEPEAFWLPSPAAAGEGLGEGALLSHTALWLAETLRPLLRSLGAQPPTTLAQLARSMPPLRAPAEAEMEAEGLWRALGRLPQRGVVALHPGSGAQAKRWPAARFAEVARLARAEGFTPLLLAGEADVLALRETLAALAQREVAAPPVAQGLSVATLAALLARCAGYIGCDSGVSHLAALVGAPTLAVFGPSDPARWAPVGPRARALRLPANEANPDAPRPWPEADAAWVALHALLERAGG